MQVALSFFGGKDRGEVANRRLWGDGWEVALVALFQRIFVCHLEPVLRELGNACCLCLDRKLHRLCVLVSSAIEEAVGVLAYESVT